MSPTLPLFLELEPADAAGDRREPAASRRRPNDRAAGDQHLRAAWRLARSMRRLPRHSTEQTRTGLAICAHLRASLAEAERLQNL